MGDPINDFVDLQGNINTRSAYQSAVRRYLDFVYGPVRKGRMATREEALRYEELAVDYLGTSRNYSIDLQKYAASLNAAKAPPTSAHFWLKVAKEFLKTHGIEITDDQWKAVRKRRPKGSRARTREGTFSRELIQKILPYMSVRTKAVFLTMLSSGMRIGECILLELDDIFLDESPVRIEIPGHITKSGDPRTVFISREAAAAVRAWLDVRDGWLKSAVNRNNGLLAYHRKERVAKIIEDDRRIFPVADSTVQDSFIRSLRKAGVDDLDPNTNRRRIHLHQCRKFFRTRLAQVIPVDAVELLMGHSGYLADAYVRYSVEELRQLYVQGEAAVTVSVPDEVAAVLVGEDLNRLKDENSTLRAELAQIQNEMAVIRAMQAEIPSTALQALIDRRIQALKTDQ